MLRNKLSTAIKVTSSLLVFGLASQVNAIEFQAGDAKVEISGYARLNASYDIDENIATSRGTRSGNFSLVNTGTGKEAKGHFGADAFQSRLGIKTTLPQGVKINVEGDFRSISGTPGQLRIRHAYGEYNGVLLGRTWSNFNSFVGNTSGLEFDGMAGAAGYQGRNSQARYTTGAFSVALEDPRTSVFGSSDEKNGIPTLTARYETSSGAFSYSAAALLQEVAIDNGTADDSALGYGVFGAAKLALTDAFSIQGALNYNDGANGYLWRSGNNYSGADAYVNGGSLETISGYGGVIGASLKMGPGSINTAIGMTEMDWDDAVADGIAGVGAEHERNTNAMLNYQWSVVKAVKFGVQYTYFKVKKVSGDDGDASRLLFAAQYNF
ncbi:DcaP family trimeric outer membrane transporter [Marinobacter sp.]|uniref:DcaP family trimeric outer membrane transporter n=1 Tax=Marinobacter sp. TaxID=50741 RepID=UPI003A8E8129